MKYKIFKRSAVGWRQFATAREFSLGYANTAEEAARICQAFNDNRTQAQIRRGTKAEFTSEY